MSIALAGDASLADIAGNAATDMTVVETNDNSYRVDNGPAVVAVAIAADKAAIKEGETITYTLTRTRRLANPLNLAVALDVASTHAPNHETDIPASMTVTLPAGTTTAAHSTPECCGRNY